MRRNLAARPPKGSKVRDVRRLVAVAAGMAALLACRSAEAQTEPVAPTRVDQPSFEMAGSDVDEPPGWRFDAALYMWLPGVFGTVEAHDRTAHVDLTVDKVIDLVFDRWRALDGGGHFEAHYDRFDLFADVVGGYVKPSASATTERLGRPVRFDARLTAHFVFAEFGIAYRVLEWSVPDRRRPISIGLLAGGRYYHMNNDITATRTGELSQQELSAESPLNFADPIIGIRWEVPLLDSLALDFQADIGGFGAGSELSYSVVPVMRWWAPISWETRPWLGVGYKLLALDIRSGHSGANLQLRGPWIGGGIEF